MTIQNIQNHCDTSIKKLLQHKLVVTLSVTGKYVYPTFSEAIASALVQGIFRGIITPY